MGMFGGTGSASVNSRGDVFNASTINRSGGNNFASRAAIADPISILTKTGVAKNNTQALDMFLNWLTAGAAPKPVDPGTIFAQAESVAPLEQKAAKGEGVAGLFGNGPLVSAVAPIQPIKPLNMSPLQTGVPYSTPALPKVGG